MKPENKLLFTCARQHFLSEHRDTVAALCRSTDVDWKYIYVAAEQQGIAPLIHTNLKKYSNIEPEIPQEIANRFEASLIHNAITKKIIADKIVAALSFFNQKAIDVMLIKGAAHDILVYEQQWYVLPGDVDLVIRVREEELPKQLLHEIGAHLESLPYHWDELEPPKFIEWDFYEHHDVTMNGVLQVDFERIWRNAMQIDFEGQEVFLMSPEDMLISTCINSCRKRFFWLKSLCSISEIIAKYPNLNWEELVELARKEQYNNIIYTALLATQMTIGCSLPDGLQENLVSGPVRAAIVYRLTSFLSQRTSLTVIPWHSGLDVLGRQIGLPMTLPYASYTGSQIWRKLKFVWATKDNPLGKIRPVSRLEYPDH